MALRQVLDRDELEGMLRRDARLHLYALGDLDDFFWPHCRFFEHRGNVALVYEADPAMPIVQAMDAQRELLHALREVLPPRVYTHLPPGMASELGQATSKGLHDRMVLTELAPVDTAQAVALGPGDAEELRGFFGRVYPGNWFDPRMLATSTYHGVRGADGDLLSVAGVHVVSRRYRVAALGNITTCPSARGKGLARCATAAVCKALDGIDPIGLNVESSNAAAIALYRRLGFEYVTTYEEAVVCSEI